MSSFHARLGVIAAVLFAATALQGRASSAATRRAQRARLLGGARGVARARGGDRGLRAAAVSAVGATRKRPPARSAPQAHEAQRFAGAAVCALAVLLLAAYAVSSGARSYGHMSDEFYYLECAGRLAWGYVDHPPLSIAMLALVKSSLGTSQVALRFLPALAACLNVVLGGAARARARRRRSAQALAALCRRHRAGLPRRASASTR